MNRTDPTAERAGTATTDERRVARLKWVIGTPYFVQGTSNLAEIPTLYFIKFTLGMGEAGGQLFTSLRGLGWFVKPLWGRSPTGCRSSATTGSPGTC